MRLHFLVAMPVLVLANLACGGADSSRSLDPGNGVELPLRLSLETEELGAGASSTGTLKLRDPAPEQGALVTLAASDAASLAMLPAITIAPGDDTGTFVLTNSYSGDPKQVTITAVYDSVAVQRILFIPHAPAEPPPCVNHACTR
jgi:hypothetical protein